jgi:pimeloyl-ACP methyl ester carboxylesterase
MNEQLHVDDTRLRRAVSHDGTEIAATVYGAGPPLVLVHGALGDGDLHWGRVAAHLRARLTCHLMSTRGRGASAQAGDVSPERLVQDVVAYVESIGEPVRLVGTSGGGALVLGAAPRLRSLSCVAAYEPALLELMDEKTFARFREVVARMQAAASAGQMAEAARIFVEIVANDDELSVLAEGAFSEACARYVPLQLQEFQHALEATDLAPTHADALKAITVPLLLLHGSRTTLDWFTHCVRYAADHVSGARVRAIEGAGHCAPIVEPQRVADELQRFLIRR